MCSSPASDASTPLSADSPELLLRAFQQLDEPLLMTTAQLDEPGPAIVAANAAFCRMTGYTLEELVGRTPRLLQGPLTDRTTLARLREQASRGERFLGEAINYRKDGSTYRVEWSMNAIRDAAGEITHFVAVQRELAPRPATPAAAHPLPVLCEQSALLAEAVMVLEKTKRSFRSTELAQLRRQLEDALRRWSGLVGSKPANGKKDSPQPEAKARR